MEFSNKQEARDYIQWYKDEASRHNYLVRFKTVPPFPILYPEAGDKKRRAEIFLGVHIWQQPLKKLQKRYPEISKEKYRTYRIKYGIE